MAISANFSFSEPPPRLPFSGSVELQAKHGIKIRFNLAVEATAEKELKPEATGELRKALEDISDA
jgi:hypothetical protein